MNNLHGIIRFEVIYRLPKGNYYLKKKLCDRKVFVTCYQSKFGHWNFIANVNGNTEIKGCQWFRDLEHCKLCAFDNIFEEEIKV
ncbi:MAG: hypothetical protein AAFS12_00060 [Cyanobacteria bacterium J06632_19]